MISKSYPLRGFLLRIAILTFFLHCEKKPVVEDPQGETIEYSDSKLETGFLPPSHKKVAPFLEQIKSIEETSSSFQADFALKINRLDTGEKINLDGKIFFEKEGSKCKIQIQDPFFGMILSQILANPNQIRIKSSGTEGIHTQPMEDLILKDPGTQKTFRIPFPVIFQTISLNFSEEFQKTTSSLNSEEKKVKTSQNGDSYLYVFYDGGLESLEYHSKEKQFQAKTKVSESSKKGIHPPEKIITKVTDMISGKDLSVVETTMKNIKKVPKIPDSVFRF